MRLLVALPITVGLALTARWLLIPGQMNRTQIAPGVYMEVFEITNAANGQGAVMITEVHWDTPGVEIVFRPFDDAMLAKGNHYKLASPSWIAFKNQYVVLMNTTRFGPGGWYRNYPGSPVSSFESTVVGGKWSHVHEHSYMVWWDAQGNAHFDTTKPPSPAALRDAVFGFGVQAIHVSDGKVNYGAIGGHLNGAPFSQSFVGIDPDRKILWLVAYQHATERFASEFIASKGARFAGRLDSGRGTSMVAGPSARNVFPFTGIRNERFLGNYIAIRFRDVARASRPKPPKQG